MSAREARAIFFLGKGVLFFNLKPSSKVERECFCEVEGSKVDPRYACNKCCV